MQNEAVVSKRRALTCFGPRALALCLLYPALYRKSAAAITSSVVMEAQLENIAICMPIFEHHVWLPRLENRPASQHWWDKKWSKEWPNQEAGLVCVVCWYKKRGVP